jgi:acetyl esterase/lipase
VTGGKRQPLEDLYTHWADTMARNPGMSIDEIRELFEHWGDVTAEPRAVDYIEADAGGIEAMWANPKVCAADRVLLCTHGGGYVLGSMYSHRKLYGHFAKAVGCSALIVNYRRAPEHPHPGPVNDVVQSYRWLLDSGRAESHHVAFVGDSAGGALAITAMLRARQLGLPLPAASIPLAPYLDTEALGASYDTNAGRDKLGSRQGTLQFMNVFLGENGNRRDSLANPLYADLVGLPPMLIQVGGDDVLLDDSRRFAAEAGAAGVPIQLRIAPGMQHVYQFLAGNAPEADRAIEEAAAWVRPLLGLAVRT